MVRRLSLVLAAVMALSLVPVATSATSGQTSAGAKKVTIKILARLRVVVPHDTAPKGKENKGDWLQYQSLLLTVEPMWGRTKNKPVGFERGTQTYTTATDARVKGTTTFPGQGTIRYRGAMRSLPNGNITVQIVGGTGKFTGAKGTLLIGPGDKEAVNTYRLTIPDVGVA